MNRYDFYPGDFARDTSDLTILEDGIYRRLLDWYYSNERPIPEDRAALIVRASNDEEKEKTHWVLSRFFTREEEKPIGLLMGSNWVWRSSRCDREIEKARIQIEANRRNGLLGGRPKKSYNCDDNKTQIKPNGFPNGLANGNPMGNPRGNPNETLPSPSPSPSPSEKESIKTTNPRASALDFDFDLFWKSYPKKVGKTAALKSFQKARKSGLPEIHVLIAAIEQQRKSDQWRRDNGQFIPNPSTWLNQGRWDDVLKEGPGRKLLPQERSQIELQEWLYEIEEEEQNEQQRSGGIITADRGIISGEMAADKTNRAGMVSDAFGYRPEIRTRRSD